MSSALATVILGLGVLSSAPIAASQSVPPTDAAYVIAAYEVVACAYNKDRPGMRQALKSLPGLGASSGIFISAQPASCLRPPITDFRIYDFLLRGAVAELMFKQDFNVDGSIRNAKVGRVFEMPSEAQIQAVTARSPRFRTELQMVMTMECAARATPAAAHAVLATQVRSAAERTALKTMLPTIETCVAQGQQAAFDQSVLRAYLAEATYRISVANVRQHQQAAR